MELAWSEVTFMVFCLVISYRSGFVWWSLQDVQHVYQESPKTPINRAFHRLFLLIYSLDINGCLRIARIKSVWNWRGPSYRVRHLKSKVIYIGSKSKNLSGPKAAASDSGESRMFSISRGDIDGKAFH